MFQSLHSHFSDVSQPVFCTEFCGWHTYNGNIKYGWIGIPFATCGCYTQYKSPNGNPYVDGAITSIAHEIIETATDPMLNARVQL
jgi:hypothetical protein